MSTDQSAQGVSTDPAKVAQRWMQMIDYAYQCRDDIRLSCGTTPRSSELRLLQEEMRATVATLVSERDALASRVRALEGDPKSLNAKIADQLRPFLKPGDKVIWREAFRWHDDNGVMSNHYDGMSVAGLADEFGYQFDWDFNMNHAAIVRAALTTTSGDSHG